METIVLGLMLAQGAIAQTQAWILVAIGRWDDPQSFLDVVFDIP